MYIHLFLFFIFKKTVSDEVLIKYGLQSKLRVQISKFKLRCSPLNLTRIRKYCGNHLHFQTILVFSEYVVESAFYPKEKKSKAYQGIVEEYKSMPENVFGMPGNFALVWLCQNLMKDLPKGLQVMVAYFCAIFLVYLVICYQNCSDLL